MLALAHVAWNSVDSIGVVRALGPIRALTDNAASEDRLAVEAVTASCCDDCI